MGYPGLPPLARIIIGYVFVHCASAYILLRQKNVVIKPHGASMEDSTRWWRLRSHCGFAGFEAKFDAVVNQMLAAVLHG